MQLGVLYRRNNPNPVAKHLTQRHQHAPIQARACGGRGDEVAIMMERRVATTAERGVSIMLVDAASAAKVRRSES